MDYYTLKINGLIRKLPLVKLGARLKVASFNLLGDQELVDKLAIILADKLKGVSFDYLVGPEVKVVPLLHELTYLLKKKRYVVCRKEIHGYMVSPIKSRFQPRLVLDGNDAKMLKGKKVIIIDDVVTSGQTISVVEELMKKSEAEVAAKYAIFKQGDGPQGLQEDLTFLYNLPVFTS